MPRRLVHPAPLLWLLATSLVLAACLLAVASAERRLIVSFERASSPAERSDAVRGAGARKVRTLRAPGAAVVDDDANGRVDDVRGWNFVAGSASVLDDRLDLEGPEWLAVVRAPEGATVVRRAGDRDSGPRWAALYSGATGHAPDVPGVLVALLGPLAAAGVPVMVASTRTADVVLVPAERLDAATSALRAAGHVVDGGSPS